MKNELIRLKAGLLAAVMSISMTGCSNNLNGFIYTEGENNKYIAASDTYLMNNFLDTCYVAEIYNELTNETELHIVKKIREYYDSDVDENVVEYNDILTPLSVYFLSNNEVNNFIKIKQLIALEDYINALGLTQYKYSYDDMVNILNKIKEVHQYTDNLELTK